MTREYPYDNNDKDLHDRVKNGERPVIPRWFPDALREIVTSCWSTNCETRPNIHEILKSLDNCIKEYIDVSREYVDTQINNFILDEQGKLFWQKYFPTSVSKLF